MKLNLGSNNRIRDGYINVDKDHYPGVDIVGDVFKLNLPDGEATEIYASHILEHAPHTRTLEILKEWYRLLDHGGILKIAVPNFERAVEIYQKDGLSDWLVNFLWGDQCYEGANHYTGFDEKRLTALLKEAGFKDISRVEFLPGNNAEECSNLVSTLDLKPVSLNMLAVKD